MWYFYMCMFIVVKRSKVLKETLEVQSTQTAGEEFAVMLSKLLALVSFKYSKPEELQQLLVKCMQVTMTTNSETSSTLLISSEQKMKFGNLNSIHDMFMYFQQHWSWCDFDLLKHIVKLFDVKEASQLIETYDYMTEWRIELKEEGGIVSSQVMPYHFCKVVIVTNESCDYLSKQQYRNLKSKLLHLGKLQEYSLFFNGEVFKPLLKVYLYVRANVAEDMIKALKQAKRELSQVGFVFIKVEDTVLVDETG